MTFFTTLANAMPDNTGLVVQIRRQADGTLSVDLLPPQDGNPALSQPLLLQASAAELDGEFAGIVGRFANARKSLSQALADAELLMQAAEKEAKGKASSAVAKASASAEMVEEAKAQVAPAPTTSAASSPEIELF